ncbi:gamma-glutamylcyclotransferase family protein [Brevundimonas sp.]|uniref:gamma-glutamylcyclotransferase family protein n=1 Tax=Brevundimonas sp. TaxID=1871086 RepID=UPI003D0FF4E6
MAEVLLFSYGTLQDPAVQQANFGRLLTGTPDSLTGFVLGEIEITDPEVIAESGLTHHRILHPSGDPADVIPGMVFRLTEDELAAADLYEAEDYKRVLVTLASGLEAWVYVAA